MKICPKCLSVYASTFVEYCHLDGRRCLDTASKDAEPFIEKLKVKQQNENN
jgi:hypothetical protein